MKAKVKYHIPVPGMRANVKYHKGWDEGFSFLLRRAFTR
jgi:hypothetical protein